jgi:hypothetical protein
MVLSLCRKRAGAGVIFIGSGEPEALAGLRAGGMTRQDAMRLYGQMARDTTRPLAAPLITAMKSTTMIATTVSTSGHFDAMCAMLP